MKITAKHIQQIEAFLNESEPKKHRQISHITGKASADRVHYLVRVSQRISTLEVIFYDREGKHLPYFHWIENDVMRPHPYNATT